MSLKGYFQDDASQKNLGPLDSKSHDFQRSTKDQWSKWGYFWMDF